MCGIIFATRKNNASIVKPLLKRFEHQRSRGIQGFGYIPVVDGKISEIVRRKYEYGIKQDLQLDDKNKTRQILFHHRFPTSTENHAEVTHPLVVSNDMLEHNYYVVHNGVIRNCDPLKKEFEEMGFEYSTIITETNTTTIQGEVISEKTSTKFNDSESFAIDLALVLDGKSESIKSRGTIAFVCFQTDKEDNIVKIHFGRNEGNPLVVEDNNDLFFIKSLGSGETVPEHTLHTVDYKSWEISTRPLSIGWQFEGIKQKRSKTSHVEVIDEDHMRYLPSPYSRTDTTYDEYKQTLNTLDELTEKIKDCQFNIEWYKDEIDKHDLTSYERRDFLTTLVDEKRLLKKLRKELNEVRGNLDFGDDLHDTLPIDW